MQASHLCAYRSSACSGSSHTCPHFEAPLQGLMLQRRPPMLTLPQAQQRQCRSWTRQGCNRQKAQRCMLGLQSCFPQCKTWCASHKLPHDGRVRRMVSISAFARLSLATASWRACGLAPETLCQHTRDACEACPPIAHCAPCQATSRHTHLNRSWPCRAPAAITTTTALAAMAAPQARGTGRAGTPPGTHRRRAGRCTRSLNPARRRSSSACWTQKARWGPAASRSTLPRCCARWCPAGSRAQLV